MRILVIGSGGREHALAWKMAQNPQNRVFVAPGNGATAGGNIENVAIKADDLPGLLEFARGNGIDLVVPGPELPLTLGVTDVMRGAGIPCFGPDAYCARLEGSKSFAKEVMAQAGVPTAAHAEFEDYDSAAAYVRQIDGPCVIKADGLAAGKGVVVAADAGEALEALAACLRDRAFGDAGARVLIEEKLEGEEVSLLYLCDGERAVPLPSAQDHKAAFDNDAGPNTGGMGAYSPAPAMPDDMLGKMAESFALPILEEMRRRGHPFTGVLYAGLMLTPSGPKVLEYNVRFGDPECQPLLMRLEGDLGGILLSAAKGELDPSAVRCRPEAALGVVLAARGYPGAYEKGMEIMLPETSPAAQVFCAGVSEKDGSLVASGGRVCCATATGSTLAEARSAAYRLLGGIKMDNGHFRNDIGNKGLKRLLAMERA